MLPTSTESERPNRQAAGLHIPAKAIPPDILNRKGPLENEIAEVRRHTENGAAILREAGRAGNDLSVRVALFHHEHFDGSGYPFQIGGEEIPPDVRIVTIADVYDALRSKRPYKTALSPEQVLDIMLNSDGRTDPTHFDPDLLAIFHDIRELDQVWTASV